MTKSNKYVFGVPELQADTFTFHARSDDEAAEQSKIILAERRAVSGRLYRLDGTAGDAPRPLTQVSAA